MPDGCAWVLARTRSMKTHVEFRSDKFPPYEGEEDEINPGRYGKRVAEFLVRGLEERGFEPLEPSVRDKRWSSYEEFNRPARPTDG
jgi:hypothetical protein